MDIGVCDVCGEFDCDINHDEEKPLNEVEPDEGHWFFDSAGVAFDN